MKSLALLSAVTVLFSQTVLAAEPQRCLGGMGACFRIQGQLRLIPNSGFLLDVEGSRMFTMSRHPPPSNVAEIIGLDLSAQINGIFNVCPIRHDTTSNGHRHLYCIEEVQDVVVIPSGSAKPTLCKTYTCKK